MRCTERMRETRAGHVSARALPPPLHACVVSAQYLLAHGSEQTMAEWSLQDLVSPINEFAYQCPTRQTCYQERAMEPPPPPGLPRRQRPPPAHPQPSTSQAANMALHLQHHGNSSAAPRGDSPRELRNKAEKRRRDRLNQSVAELAAMVPPVVHAHRKMDKTSVLRLTAHYLRAHQHVFGDSIGQSNQEFTPSSMKKILNLFNGFLITVTYKGLFVVVSENVREYLGYSELDLLGQNILGITHEDDRAMLLEQLMPKSQTLGPNGELLMTEEPGAKALVEDGLAQEKRQFIIRFKKHGQRSDPNQYVTCHVQGSFRKSDRACSGPNRCCQVVRRVRARTENPYSSGNDIVFIGIVRPSSETFLNESALESYRMEYRTRHSIDGQIIQCESRIALVTGYMTHEVSGMNAMNFMHRDDVRWVAIALRDMYDTHKLYGESCYRLMTKNGQFIYMRTWGRLIVEDNGACTSFVCTNTVVDEKDGKHLIKLMRKKYTLSVSKVPMPAIEGFEDEIQDEINYNDPGPVEDPRRLKEVILNLVTDLPGPPTDDDLGASSSSTNSASLSQRFTIIPPKMEVIVSGISKIYDVIKSFDQDQNVPFGEENNSHMAQNRPVNGNSFEEPIAGAFQEGKIMDLSSFDSNEVFHFKGPSSSSLACAPVVTEPENIVNTERGATCLLNEDYIDNSPCGYPSVSGINFNNNLNNTYGFEQQSRTNLCETNSQLDFYPFTTSSEEVAFFEMLPEPSMINYQSGLKRSNEYENEDFSYKKKNTEADQHLQPEPEMTAFDSSNLESFFDETHLNTQLETAINSLDTIDPTFPDLLVSTDVQNILGQLENELKDGETLSKPTNE